MDFGNRMRKIVEVKVVRSEFEFVMFLWMFKFGLFLGGFRGRFVFLVVVLEFLSCFFFCSF